MSKLLFTVFCLFGIGLIHGQQFSASYGVLGTIQLVLGNQNQKIDAGISLFGALQYGDAAIESGFNFSAGQLLKRHTIRQPGRVYRYEFFGLTGIGSNSNLLGAALFDSGSTLLYRANGKGGFHGIGFGFQKEFLPGTLDFFSIRRGKFLMRFSNANHSIDVSFMNDFRFGRLFYGQGTDFGPTGTLQIGFTQINSIDQVYRTGIGVALFTPKPDYTRTPRNYINSDDGRYNVWFTKASFQSVYYANIYAFGTYQENFSSATLHLGINSQKLGAYIQNTLHDGPGLNPRFPWDVFQKNKLFYELTGSLYKRILSDE